jgi:peptidoglycan/LPS O-acetylase OafA/YrhL
MTDYIDGYCERVMPGFWDEPLNAVTNLAFIIAALILWRLAARAGTARRPTFLIPTVLLALTGVGSFLFHTLANGWSGMADTLALGFCLLATIYAAARRFLGLSWYLALIWPVGMLVAAIAFGRFVPVPGSFYFGPLAAGGVFALALVLRGHPAGRWIGAAVLVFLPSFFFRTIDEPLCESFHYGTHFLWHILNGIVLGLAIRPLAWCDGGGENNGTGRATG